MESPSLQVFNNMLNKHLKCFWEELLLVGRERGICVGGEDCLGDLTNPLGSAFLFMFGRLRDLVTGIW